jgi:hypothetical protein
MADNLTPEEQAAQLAAKRQSDIKAKLAQLSVNQQRIDGKVNPVIHGLYEDMMKTDHRAEDGKNMFGRGPGLEHGYGMGWGGSIKASRGTHASNILRHLNPLGSAGESMMNATGFLTRAQKIKYANGGIMGKIEQAAIPLGVGYVSIRGMIAGDDAGDIMASNMALGAGVTGFRVGKAIGGVLTGQGKGISRILAQGGIGAIGFAAGMAAFTGAYEGGKDLVSNESAIGKAARSVFRRESMVNTPETRATLTARQRNFQKLSNSGINDRMDLMGNESLVLKNLL